MRIKDIGVGVPVTVTQAGQSRPAIITHAGPAADLLTVWVSFTDGKTPGSAKVTPRQLERRTR